MNRVFKTLAAVCISAGVCLSFAACGKEGDKSISNPDENNQYSIITKLDLNVNFDGNTAKAVVKNTFTLFPATATVYVYLYFSESYETDYSKMQEVAQNYTEDLDMNKSLTASYEMEGVDGYFLARMRYKIDSRKWEERTTDAYKRDYSGIYMQTIEDDGSLPVFEDIQPVYFHNSVETIFVINDRSDNPYDCYKKFTAAYSENFNAPLDKEFFVLNFKTSEYRLGHMPYPNYCRLGKNEAGKYVLSTGVQLYIEELGMVPPSPPSDIDSGIPLCNLALLLDTANLDGGNLSGKLRLEFGIRKEGSYVDFINLYVGDFCFGTCYIIRNVTEKDITYAFYYNMFVEELISNLEIT